MEILEQTKIGSEDVMVFRLKNASGACADIGNNGCIVQRIAVPDKNGALRDVALGFDAFSTYGDNPAYFGCVVGRYANRIAKGRFSLNGQEYALTQNEGENQLHGGFTGFNRRVFRAEARGETLVLQYLSPDGEEGFPGNADIRVEYAFSDDNALSIRYYAVSDRPTVMNLTNHSYFNLAGQGSGNVLSHMLKIHAGYFLPVMPNCIPTGEKRPVGGTPFDFREFRAIGGYIGADEEQLKLARGYDHNYILDKQGFGLAAEAYSPESGIFLKVYTTKPGVQLYTGNHLNILKGKGGAAYPQHGGFCLETQYYPDSPNHPEFPSPVLNPGIPYDHRTVYKFGLYRD